MLALTTLFPVFFMLGLGWTCRKMNWITPEQKSGANAIVFNVLFPILIFHLICTTTFEIQHIKIIGYVLLVFILSLGVGKWVAPFIDKQYAHFLPYLLPTVEGGSVALPLYLSIVGTSSHTVIFDIAGSIMCFMIIPVLVIKETAKQASIKEQIKAIFTNAFVLAVVFGLCLNLSGIYGILMDSSLSGVINATFSQVTMPIVSMILFILGYDFHIDKKTLKPIFKLMLVKTVYYALVIIGFFVLFPHQMSDKIFMIAPIIYFMCPTGFGMLPMISPLYKNEHEASLTSGFVSIYMVVTLLVYTIVVLWIA